MSYNLELSDFLVSYPPSTRKYLNIDQVIHRSSNYFNVSLPEIVLYCDSDLCQGERFFKSKDDFGIMTDNWKNLFIEYICKNCTKNAKIFSLAVFAKSENKIEVIKIGEWPPYGPHTPAKLISLIGPDKEIFLKGRRAENQGQGIGAFAYYRRVVENQKVRIFNEIIKTLKLNNIKQEIIETFENAKMETQFSNSIEKVKIIFPEILLINSHNPLNLLHSALSEGLHNKTDEECLELAKSIRIVLTELSDRLSQLSKEQAELNRAISSLFNKNTK